MGKNLLIWKKCPEECDDQLSLLYDYCPYCGAKLEINYPSTDTPKDGGSSMTFTRSMCCPAKAEKWPQWYNAFHLKRIADLIAKRDTPQNSDSGIIMKSSTWSKDSRLIWILDSFAELQFEGFTYESVYERRSIFASQIKTFKVAKMWHDVLKTELCFVPKNMTQEEKP
jgi:hypothetical protein